MASKDGKQDKAVTLNPVIRSVAGAAQIIHAMVLGGVQAVKASEATAQLFEPAETVVQST